VGNREVERHALFTSDGAEEFKEMSRFGFLGVAQSPKQLPSGRGWSIVRLVAEVKQNGRPSPAEQLAAESRAIVGGPVRIAPRTMPAARVLSEFHAAHGLCRPYRRLQAQTVIAVENEKMRELLEFFLHC
jgi:hypothetical protein